MVLEMHGWQRINLETAEETNNSPDKHITGRISGAKRCFKRKRDFAATPPMSITIARMLDACDRSPGGQCFLFPGIWVVNTTFGVFSGTGMRWYWYAWYF